MTVSSPSAPDRPPGIRAPGQASQTWVEVLIAGILAAFAAAVRLPLLWEVPRFTDEVHEIELALRIARGSALPLTNVTTFIGAFFNYLLAGLFVVFGTNEHLPRLVVFVGGVAAVVAVYGLGRALGGRPAGILAAALLSASAEHTLLNSHVAWSVCLSPLFVAGCAWALVVATRHGPDSSLGTRSARWAWPLAGALGGLALQTHGTVSTILAGLLLYAVWRGRHWLRTRWPYLGALTLLLFYVNMLAYNALTGLGTLRGIDRALASEYSNDPAQATGLAAWPDNLLALLDGWTRASGSAVLPGGGATLDLAFAVLVALLAAAGFGYAVASGRGIVAAPAVSAILVMPLLNGNYLPVLASRYLVPLVMFGLLSIALLLARLLRDGRVAIRLAGGALGLLLVLYPLATLGRYYARVSSAGCTNAPNVAFASQIQEIAGRGEPILLDKTNLEPAERLAWEYVLAMRGEDVDSIFLGQGHFAEERQKQQTSVMVLADNTALRVDVLPAELRQGLDPSAADVSALAGSLGVYRVTPASATLVFHREMSICQPVGIN
jgi:hypothetical protein